MPEPNGNLAAEKFAPGRSYPNPDDSLPETTSTPSGSTGGTATGATDKGVHTVFIHKLYNMLEDPSIRHLIWWTPADDGFYLIPGEEFSKVLAQYFKHTNIASFIRQLNMYGFHKVNDLFHLLTSDITKWEFRHLSRNFRKGDVEGLKTIKRRSLKNSHTHREVVSLKALPPGLGIARMGSPALEFSSADSRPGLVDLGERYAGERFSGDPRAEASLAGRLEELGHSLAALRHEHARLQSRYDTAVDDLKKTNLDMAHLVDIVQKMVDQAGEKAQAGRSSTSLGQSVSHRNAHPERAGTPVGRKGVEEDIASPTSGPRLTGGLDREIAMFRSSVIGRAQGYEALQARAIPAVPRPELQRHASTDAGRSHDQPSFAPRAQSFTQQLQPPRYAPAYGFPPDAMGFHQVRFGGASGSQQRHMSVLYDPLVPAPGSQRNSVTSVQQPVIYSPTAGHPVQVDHPAFNAYDGKRHLSQLELARVYSPLNGDMAPTSFPTPGQPYAQPTSNPGGPQQEYTPQQARPASTSSGSHGERTPDAHPGRYQLYQQPEVTLYVPRTYPYNVPGHSCTGSMGGGGPEGHPPPAPGTHHPERYVPRPVSPAALERYPQSYTARAPSDRPGPERYPLGPTLAVPMPGRAEQPRQTERGPITHTPESPRTGPPQPGPPQPGPSQQGPSQPGLSQPGLSQPALSGIPSIVYLERLPTQRLPSFSAATLANSGVHSLLNREEETRKRSNSDGLDPKKPRF